MRLAVLLLGLLSAAPLAAAERTVAPGADSLAQAVAGAAPGDVLRLADGVYSGPVTIDRPLTVIGPRGAVVDGGGVGSVITLAVPDIVLSGFTVTGSGNVNQDLDAGVKIVEGADRAQEKGLLVQGNMHGIDVHGGRDAHVVGNEIKQRLEVEAGIPNIVEWNNATQMRLRLKVSCRWCHHRPGVRRRHELPYAEPCVPVLCNC